MQRPLKFLSKLSLFARTVSNLKIQQILHQVWYRIRFKLDTGNIERKTDSVQIRNLESTADFINYAVIEVQEYGSQNSFCFLNEKVRFRDGIDWCCPEKGRLWRYNLHYFHYLPLTGASDIDTEVQLIKDWIQNNPIGSPDAWDPFPVSLRLVNWIKFLTSASLSEEDKAYISQSMVIQFRWLMKHLEYHLFGNHLFKNGKALVVGGLFFNGTEAERWLEKGIQIIDSQIGEQVLADGGHFERSTMYHSMILEDCLDMLNFINAEINPGLDGLALKLASAAERMVGFLKMVCHPDGRISLFNDAALGIEAEPDQLFDYYERVTGKTVQVGTDKALSLSDTGYYILAPDEQNKMIVDCGHVGPEYQPGHCHCDTLSFELSVAGQRVIVDSGCFQYVDGEIRQYNRGNKGHNTITVDEENQSEIWGAHRCARKARPLTVECRQEGSRLFFKGGHDGYKRLKGRPIHYREIDFEERTWRVLDRIEGHGRHKIESRLHLHPSLEVESQGRELYIFHGGKRLLNIQHTGNDDFEIEKGWYCPEFGKKYACDVIVYKVDQVELPFECGWKMELEV